MAKCNLEPRRRKDPALLKPIPRQRCNRIMAGLVHEGLRPFLLETLRSSARQAWLVAAGLSWVDHSRHQDGNAFDIGFKDSKGKVIWDSQNPCWDRLAHYARFNGCVAGHDWKKLDCPHVELGG